MVRFGATFVLVQLLALCTLEHGLADRLDSDDVENGLQDDASAEEFSTEAGASAAAKRVASAGEAQAAATHGTEFPPQKGAVGIKTVNIDLEEPLPIKKAPIKQVTINLDDPGPALATAATLREGGAPALEAKVEPCPPMNMYPPRNFRCFPLKGHLVCGMARPTKSQNPECGANNETVQESAYSIMKAARKWASIERQRFKLKQKSYRLVSFDKEHLTEIHNAAKAEGMRHIVFLVKDFEAPKLDQLQAFTKMVLNFDQHDKHWLLHCAGGMGRTGLFLIALMTRVFWDDGSFYFRSKASPDKMEPYEEGAKNRKKYKNWFDPVEEAIRFVQYYYHPAAGELIHVDFNFPALALFVSRLSPPKGAQYGVFPSPQAFSTRIWERRENMLNGYYAFCKAAGGGKEC